MLPAWAGRQPCPAARGRLDHRPGPAGRLRADLRPGAGQAGRQPAGRGPQHPPRVPAARADQLRRLPAGMHRPPDRGRRPLLPVPRPHRPAAGGPRGALRSPLHPRRAAGRAGLGRPVRTADRPRPGHPRTGPGARRRLAAPGAPGPAGHHRPGPGPAGPPAAAAAGRLPRRGHRPCRAGPQAPGPGPPPRHPARPAAPAGRRGPAEAGNLGAVADGIEAFCQTVRAGLATATFEQRRLLAELLIDRVVSHRRRGRDPLRAPDLPRRAASPFLPVAERPSRPVIGLQGRRTARAAARGRRPAPRQSPAPARLGRPRGPRRAHRAPAGKAAGAPAGHPRHRPALAPPPDHPQADLPEPGGTAAGQRRDRRADRAARHRESQLGIPADPR